MSSADELKELMPEKEGFPTGKGIKVIRGKTLVKNASWLKAILLTESRGRRQLRLYGWQLSKKDGKEEWKVGQKFNISHGYSADIAEIIMAFYTMKA